MQFVLDGMQIQIEVIATFLVMFEALINILFIHNLRVLCLSNGHVCLHVPIMLTIKPRLAVTCLEHAVNLFQTHVFLESHQTTCHSTKGVLTK